MKYEPVKVAVIGCGRISGHHCESIFKVHGMELEAVCDLDLEKVRIYSERFGVKGYLNYHKMFLENPEINLVVIATPSGMHYEHVHEVIQQYKKHIILEKPTFMRPSQVKEVYALAEKFQVKIFPVFQNRHNLAVKRVLKGLGSGELGKIFSLAVRVRWCRTQRYYDLSAWRGTFSMDGGCLTNQGIHHVDLVRQFGGEVSRLCSLHRTLGANIEVEDAVSATLLFDSGAIGTLEITTAARPIDYEASISIVCERGLAQIGGIAVNELQIYTPDPKACILNSEDFSGNVYGNGHLKIYEEIVGCMNDKNLYSISFKDVLSTIQLLNAFYLSDEGMEWINVSTAGDSIRLGSVDDSLANLYRTTI